MAHSHNPSTWLAMAMTTPHHPVPQCWIKAIQHGAGWIRGNEACYNSTLDKVPKIGVCLFASVNPATTKGMLEQPTQLAHAANSSYRDPARVKLQGSTLGTLAMGLTASSHWRGGR